MEIVVIDDGVNEGYFQSQAIKIKRINYPLQRA